MVVGVIAKFSTSPCMNEAFWKFIKEVVVIAGRVEMWSVRLLTPDRAKCGQATRLSTRLSTACV